MTAHPISRRRVLAGAAALAGATVFTGSHDQAMATPVPPGGAWHASTTANGWPVIAEASRFRIEGTNHSVLLAPAAAPLLLHCLRRYHYEIDSAIPADEIVGHTTSGRVSVAYESNYRSGSAIAVRPGWYPLDATGGLFEHEVMIIRDILADCEGLVRWGGDDARPKESHFQIDVGPNDAALQRASSHIRRQARTPGSGAGSAIDPFDARRLRRAQAVHTRQLAAR